jgi:hypothetical protein
MRRLSFSYDEILNLVLPLLFAFWLHGAIKQAEHRVVSSSKKVNGRLSVLKTG